MLTTNSRTIDPNTVGSMGRGTRSADVPERRTASPPGVSPGGKRRGGVRDMFTRTPSHLRAEVSASEAAALALAQAKPDSPIRNLDRKRSSTRGAGARPRSTWPRLVHRTTLAGLWVAGCMASAAAPAAAQYVPPPPDPGFEYVFDGSATGSDASFDKWV